MASVGAVSAPSTVSAFGLRRRAGRLRAGLVSVASTAASVVSVAKLVTGASVATTGVASAATAAVATIGVSIAMSADVCSATLVGTS